MPSISISLNTSTVNGAYTLLDVIKFNRKNEILCIVHRQSDYTNVKKDPIFF